MLPPRLQICTSKEVSQYFCGGFSTSVEASVLLWGLQCFHRGVSTSMGASALPQGPGFSTSVRASVLLWGLQYFCRDFSTSMRILALPQRLQHFHGASVLPWGLQYFCGGFSTSTGTSVLLGGFSTLLRGLLRLCVGFFFLFSFVNKVYDIPVFVHYGLDMT